MGGQSHRWRVGRCWVKGWWLSTVTYLWLRSGTPSDHCTLKCHESCNSGFVDWLGSSVSAQCSPADRLPGPVVSWLAEAPTEDLRACLVSGSGIVSTAWSPTSAPGSKCAAMSVREPETESDTDWESLIRSGVQHELTVLHPLFLLSVGWGRARPGLAAPAPFVASVSVWALLHVCLVSGEYWTVSCVPVQRGLCSVSGPVLPLGPISGNTPWGMPPPIGLAEKSKRGFF